MNTSITPITTIATIAINISYHNLDAVIRNLNIFNNKYQIISSIKINKNRATYIVNDLKNNVKKVLKFVVTTYIDNNLSYIYNFFLNNKHKNFIKINTIIECDIFTIFDMDYIEGINMYDYFMNISERINCYNILFDLVFALNYLHDNNIVHGDIKPNNIIIHNEGYPIIIDYDLCKQCDTEFVKSKPFGTKIFIAPELINNNIFLNKSDIWSLGISLIICILYKYKYITCIENIIISNEDKSLPNISKNIVNVFNINKEHLISIYGKLFINSISIMLIENYTDRISSESLSKILKQSNYYLYSRDTEIINDIKIIGTSKYKIKQNNKQIIQNDNIITQLNI